MKKTKNYFSKTTVFLYEMNNRALPVYAASGCYYLFMSLVPFVMILCCLLPYTPFNQELVLGYVNKYFPSQLGNVLNTIVNAVYSSNSATLTISILLTLYSASASMRALMKGLNAAYGFKKKDNIIIWNLKSLLFLILMLVAILVSLVILVYGSSIVRLINRYIPQYILISPLKSGIRYVVMICVLTLFFTLLYYLLPTEKVRIRGQIPGAVFASVLWVIFSAAFSWYVNISNRFGAFGFLGTILVVMIWMFYCLLFVLIGGFINSKKNNCTVSTT